MPKILAFAGSTRTASFNKRLVRIAADAAESAGAEVTRIDLADHPLPLFDQDYEDEHGVPETAQSLKRTFIEHDGFLLASPEYNSSITAVLKNTIDWLSRREGDEQPLAAFQGKVAALMSASPGKLGGMRGLVHVRSILGNIGAILLPDQIAVPQANAAFAEDGSLKDRTLHERVQSLGSGLTAFLAKLAD